MLPAGWQVKDAYPDLAEMTIWAVEACYPADMPEVLPVDAQRSLATARHVLELIDIDFLTRSVNSDNSADTTPPPSHP